MSCYIELSPFMNTLLSHSSFDIFTIFRLFRIVAIQCILVSYIMLPCSHIPSATIHPIFGILLVFPPPKPPNAKNDCSNLKWATQKQDVSAVQKPCSCPYCYKKKSTKSISEERCQHINSYFWG